MRIIDLFGCSIKELKANRLRTILTIFAIVISTVFLISLIGAGDGLKKFLYRGIDEEATAKHITIYTEINEDFSKEEVDLFLKLSAPKAVRIIRKCVIDSFDEENLFTLIKPVSLLVYDDQYDLLTQSEISAAEIKMNGKIKAYKEGEGVYINENLIINNGIHDIDSILNKSITFVIYGENEPLEIKLPIIGVIDATIETVMDKSQCSDIYIPYSLFVNTSIQFPVQSITLDMGNYLIVGDMVEKLSAYQYPIIAKQDIIKKISEEVLLYNGILMIAGSLILCVTILSLINTLNISLKDRIKFFGKLKAFGFRSKHIFVICILQSFIIGVIGCVIGTGLSLFMSKFIGFYLAKSLMFEQQAGITYEVFKINGRVAVYGIIVMLLTCIISSILPAIRSAFLSPIEALANEK